MKKRGRPKGTTKEDVSENMVERVAKVLEAELDPYEGSPLYEKAARAAIVATGVEPLREADEWRRILRRSALTEAIRCTPGPVEIQEILERATKIEEWLLRETD